MERPKTKSKKTSWFGYAGVFLLLLFVAFGMQNYASAASGSLDRNNYLPARDDTTDFDRAWITVTDS